MDCAAPKKWAEKRGGVFLKSYQSRSEDDQQKMIAVSGPLCFIAGIGFIISSAIDDFDVTKYIVSLLLALLF